MWAPDPRFGPVPDWLGDVFDTVLADLQLPTPIDVQLGFVLESSLLWVSEPSERSRTGFQAFADESSLERLVRVAAWLQEQFFWETRAAWGQARPACPDHPHPASPVELSGRAWWVCPTDARPIARIGELGRQV